MRYGLALFMTAYSIDMKTLAQRAEALGYESLWAPDHPVIPVAFTTPYPWNESRTLPEYYKHIVDPFVALATAAGATQRLKLGTSVVLVPERNPILTAIEVATLDAVSGGRFLFGIGAGWLREEGDVFGVDWKRRWKQTRDFIMAMRACWEQDVSEYQGDYVTMPPLYAYPKPVQQPHPPILIAGELKGALARIAEYGDGWVPRANLVTPREIEETRQALERRFREAGRDPSRIDITLYGSRPRKADCQSWIDAGVDRIVIQLPVRDEAESLDRIARYAAELF